MSRFFAAVPLDFDRLFQRDAEVTSRIYALGCHLSAESYRRRNTDDGVIELFPNSLAELFEVKGRTIRRWLRILEGKAQIRCEVQERQQGPWRITLTGLANPLDEAVDQERMTEPGTSGDGPMSQAREGVVPGNVPGDPASQEGSGRCPI